MRSLTFFISFFAGIFYAAGFPLLGTTYYFFPGPIIGFTLLGLQLRNIPFKKGVLHWLLFSLGLYVVGFNWIPFTLYEFGNIPTPLNYLIGVCASLILLPPIIILLALYHLTKENRLVLQYNLYGDRILCSFLITIFLEYLPTQFPAFPGHSWIFMAPYLKLASYLGEISFTFISILICFFLIDWITKKNFCLSSICITAVFVIINLLIPLKKDSNNEKFNFNLRIVQANIGNDSKTSSEKGDIKTIYDIFSRYYQLSTTKSQKKLDLIIWPETAYPYNIDTSKFEFSKHHIPSILREITDVTDASIYTGIRDNPEKKELYNSGLLLKPDYTWNIYYKNKLLPFGEYLPFGPITKYIKSYFPGIAFFNEGKKTTVFNINNNINFSSVICYEILFPNLIYSQLKNQVNYPHFIINITNDSWFGPTSEPEQHLFLSKWRSLEFGVPIVRSTNTGISTIIFPDASSTKRLNFGTEDILDYSLRLSQTPKQTFYSLYGNKTFLTFFFLYILFLFIRRKAFLK